MKHNLKITAVILAMFIATQLIGLYVVNYYIQTGNQLPYGMDVPEISGADIYTGWSFLISIVISFAIAIALVLFLVRIHSVWFMRIWFFLVVVLAIGITLNAIGSKFSVPNLSIIAITIATILGYLKIFRRNIIVHNLTELMVYPGVAAVFVPILNIWTVIILLLAISVYDIWAVWHSGVMQKMAKFQINKLKIFSGFFVPYASKKIRDKIKLLKLKYKNKKIPEAVLKKDHIKVSLAILGGGDVIFPIIAAGVFLKTFSSLFAALIVTLFATLALIYLFILAKKRKFYPAMPYITTGILAGMLVGWAVLSL